MPFFSQESRDRIVADPAWVQYLYAASSDQFRQILGGKFLNQPEDHIKLAFATILAYELKPYGGTDETSIESLLAEEGLHCGNYSNLAWKLYNIIGHSDGSDVAMIGWTGGAVGNHSQLIIQTDGKKGMLLDGTIGHIALIDDANALMSGREIPLDDQVSFFFRSELGEFRELVESALTGGMMRGGHLLYWFEANDYFERYGYFYPSPQSYWMEVGEGKNPSMSMSRPVNLIEGSSSADVLMGRAAGDRLYGGLGDDVLLGGRQTYGGGEFSERGLAPRPSGFFTTSQVLNVLDDPARIAQLYSEEHLDYVAALPEAFRGLPENYIKLAFAAAVVHELIPLDLSDSLGLSELVSAAGLPAGGQGLLTWELYERLDPGGEADTAMVRWHGGVVGTHAQLLVMMPGEDALLVDPMAGLLAITSGYNELVAGEAVPADRQFVFSAFPDAGGLRGRVITALQEGLYRGGDLAAWFETPSEIYRYDSVAYWATPQGEAVRAGAEASSSLGVPTSVDVLSGGPGADVLIGDSVFQSKGVWSGQSPGRWDWHVGDFDGDGRADVFRYLPGESGADMFLSTGVGFSSAGSWTGAGNGAAGWTVGDFDGDGRDDVFRYLPGVSGADVFLSTGSGFDHDGSWTDFGYGADGWYVGDFNGDGRDDVFRYLPGQSGADMFLSTGTDFVRAGSWTGAGNGAHGWYVADLNGDGRDDIFRYLPGQSGADVFLSTGSDFRPAGSWTGYGSGNGHWTIADVDGNGRADLLGNSLGSPGGSIVLRSSGVGFELTSEWTPLTSGQKGWVVGDFDGDGRDDLGRTDATGETSIFRSIGLGSGQGDEDRFYLSPGEVEGDVIADFEGAGVPGGDSIWFIGFGPRADLQLTNSDDFWTIANNVTGHSETFRIIGVTSLDPTDFFVG